MKGVKVQELIIFVGMPTSEKGIIHGIGRGVIMVAVRRTRNGNIHRRRDRKS